MFESDLDTNSARLSTAAIGSGRGYDRLIHQFPVLIQGGGRKQAGLTSDLARSSL